MSCREVLSVKSLIKNVNRVMEKEAVISASKLKWFETIKYYSFDADFYHGQCGNWSIEVYCFIREVEGGKSKGFSGSSYTMPSMFRVLYDESIDYENYFLNTFISNLRKILKNDGIKDIELNERDVVCKVPDFLSMKD
tara:strand:+ start:653 stop:1066 length:414 start_codon:yes stop_codon:yes gene_type:complete